MHERGQVGVLTPRTAALALADARRAGVPERYVRAAVDAQIRRTGLAPHDADDVRSEVALALLQMRPDERIACDRLCARAAAIARNKSIDVVRRERRARPADPTDLSERAPPEAQGRLLGGLDAVQAEAHLRLVRPHLRVALDELGERERVVLRAHVGGQAHAAAGLPRSTFYRALAEAREQLQSRLAAAIAAALLAPARLLQGLGGLGAPAAAGSAAVATVLVLVVASSSVNTPPPRIARPASESAQAAPPAREAPPVRAAAGAAPARVEIRAGRDTATLPAPQPARAAAAAEPAEPVARAALPAPARPAAAGGDVCPYDRSSYYC